MKDDAKSNGIFAGIFAAFTRNWPLKLLALALALLIYHALKPHHASEPTSDDRPFLHY